MPGIINQGNLLPFRQYDDNEVLNFFALNQTGQNGMFVSFVTGGQNPDNADGYSTNAVGANYTNIVSTRYLNNRTVKPAAAGDTLWQVAGVTLHTTQEFDENGNKLVLQPRDYTIERGYVVSGQSVPILKRGLVTLSMDQVSGPVIPLAGYPAIITGNGKLYPLLPSTATGSSFAPFVVGRFVSSTGSNNYTAAGGYIQFEVNV